MIETERAGRYRHAGHRHAVKEASAAYVPSRAPKDSRPMYAEAKRSWKNATAKSELGVGIGVAQLAKAWSDIEPKRTELERFSPWSQDRPTKLFKVAWANTADIADPKIEIVE